MNRTPMDETGPHDLLEIYALDALDDVERRRFERHLRGCPECRRALVQVREALARWSADEATEAPRHLRAQVLGTVAAQARPAHRRGPSGVRRRTLLGAAAAVVVGGGATAWWQARQTETPMPAADQILAAPQAHRWHSTYQGSHVTIARMPDGRAAARLDPVPAGRPQWRYTAWAARPSADLRNVGQFAEQSGTSTMLLQGDLREARAIAFTLEREGAHPVRPSGAPLFGVNLTAV